MRALLIINIATQWVFIVILLRRAYGHRLEFEWLTTFFGKTRHGFTVTLWDHPRGVYPSYGRTILTFNWRNPQTIPDRPYIKDAAKWALPRPF